jgi:hypothetical protein
MKKTAITLSILLAALMGMSAHAQTKGEADPAQSKAVPSKPATATEKAAARKDRQAEGKKVAKAATGADDTPSSSGARGVSEAERKAAAAKRKTAAADAVKKGQTTSGEK